MITCPHCNIGFNPKYRTCPKCQSYEPTLESRLESLANVAEDALDDGADPRSVTAMLVEEGVSAEEACEVVSVRARKVQDAARHRGLLRLLGGLGIGLLGSLILLLIVQTVWWWRVEMLYPGAALIELVGLLFVFGSLMSVSGMGSVLSGRDFTWRGTN